jgi:Tfp pilus assembly protein PilN
MRQDVNLLFALNPPQPAVFLPVDKIIKGLVAWLVILCVCSCVMGGFYYRDQGRLVTLTAARDKTAQKIKVRERQEPKIIDSELQKKVDRMATAVAEKKKVVDILNVEHAANFLGYTPYLRMLAEQIPRNVWLTKIDINDEGMLLGGMATHAYLVPDFAGKLKEKSPFKGVHFKYMSINKATDGRAAFVLSTRMPEKSTEDQ